MPVFDPGVPWLRGTATLTSGSITVTTDGVITLNEILEGDRLYVKDDDTILGPFEIVGGEGAELELRESFTGSTGSYPVAIDRNPITRTGAKTLRDVARILATIEDADVEAIGEIRDEAVQAKEDAQALYGDLSAVQQAKTDAEEAAGDARDDAILTAQLVGQAAGYRDEWVDSLGTLDDLEGRVDNAAPVLEWTEGLLDGAPDLETAHDRDGHLFRRTDADGLMHLPHMQEPLQDEMALRSGTMAPAHPGDDVEQVWDRNEALVRRTDGRGAFYTAPGKGPIQHHLRLPLKDLTGRFQAPLKSPRDSYPPLVREQVARLQQECLPYIEPPPLLVPNGYDVPDALLSAISLSDDNPVAQLPFPYTDGGSVHPYILPMRRPLLGYRYLLLDSCHKNSTASEETPVMFGTNDLQQFDLIPDVPNPMAHPAGGTDGRYYNSFNSDPFFSYDPTDGGLIWGTRESTVHPTARTDFILTKSYDGVNWSEKVIFEAPGGSGLSPAMLYDPVNEIWHLWQAPSEGTLDRYSAPSWKGPWALQSSVNFNSTYGARIWHFEVKYLGGRFAMALHNRQEDSQVYLALSSDGDTWTVSPPLVTPQSPNIYKPTFFPEFDADDQVRLTFMWSHWNWINQEQTPHDGMQLYIQRTDWVDLTSL